MSKKLWVEHITATNTFGPTRVSIDGCEYVDDLLEEIKKKFEIPGPASAMTLYKPDGTTKIDVGDSPADYLKENARGNPLIVRSTLIEKGILIYEVLCSIRRRLTCHCEFAHLCS